MQHVMEMLLCNGDEEIEVEVEFYYQPFEPMTKHYPGCSEEVSLETVFIAETGLEICLIDAYEFEQKILEKINTERNGK